MKDTATIEANVNTASGSAPASDTTKTVTLDDVKHDFEEAEHEIIELDCGEDFDAFINSYFMMAIPFLHPGIFNLKKLKETNFSHIFEASLKDRELGENVRVAFKVMKYDFPAKSHGELVSHFLREAKIHEAVSSHPLNMERGKVTKVYGFGSFDEAYYTGFWCDVRYKPLHYIISEFLEDKSMEDILAMNRRPLEEKTRMVRQIAEGLEITHRAGYAHLDVKPKNAVHSEKTGEVKIMDFGTAKRINSALPGTHVIGTPDYMAPEMICGCNADPRMDIFSLGVILYQMLEEHHPYAAGCIEEDSILYSIVHKKLAKPKSEEGLDTGVAQVAVKCLQRNPSKRYRHMGEVAEALDSCRF